AANEDGFYYCAVSPGGIWAFDLDLLAPGSPAGSLRFAEVRLIDNNPSDISAAAGADIDAVLAFSHTPRIHQTNKAAARLKVLGVDGYSYPLSITANAHEVP